MQGVEQGTGRGGAGTRVGGRASVVSPPAARVVVVDDLSSVRDGLTALLRTAGYEVVAVGSGPAALAELERRAADLLLTALHLPEMTGWDLVRSVRARRLSSPRGAPLCVGLYSAVLSAFNRGQLARAQVDFALTKLNDPELLLASVERALAWAEIP